MADEPGIAQAYDASHVTFRVLRAFGWGPLLNFGYYPLAPPLTLLNFMLLPLPLTRSSISRPRSSRLVHRSVGLLALAEARASSTSDARRGLSSFVMASSYPHARVSGLDLLARHVERRARTLYGNTPNLAYSRGDAMALPFAAGAFDRLLCLEAAFQFPDRGRFLGEAHRVLDAGGRGGHRRFRLARRRPRRLGRSGRRPRAADLAAGRISIRWTNTDDASSTTASRSKPLHDWSANVLAPLHTIAEWVAWLGGLEWGRWLLCRQNPLLRALAPGDWEDFGRVARATRSRSFHRLRRARPQAALGDARTSPRTGRSL